MGIKCAFQMARELFLKKFEHVVILLDDKANMKLHEVNM